MFVGHYAAAFALKGTEKRASLGLLFLATQWVDILYFPFVLLGWEDLTFVDHFTAVNNFKMEFPYTHGLVASCGWGLLTFLAYWFFAGKNKSLKVGLVLALAVISHWFTHVLVHTPDLPLVTGNPKFGLGLWHSKVLTFAVEAIFLLAGWGYYYMKTVSQRKGGKFLSLWFVGLLLLVNYLNLYVLPSENNIWSLTISALAAYVVFALMAFRVDKYRA